MECERRTKNDERHTYALPAVFLTTAAVGALLWDSDTKVVETSVITAGILEMEDEVLMLILLVEDVVDTVEDVLEAVLEVLDELVLESEEEEEEAPVEDDDEEVEVEVEVGVVDVVVGVIGSGRIGVITDIDAEVDVGAVLDKRYKTMCG